MPRQFNDAYSYQKINGIPITNEIWNELNIFKDIDFIIIETYDEKHPEEHHGQYFDANTVKLHIYPAFSFGLTDVISTDAKIKCGKNKTNIMFMFHTRQSKDDAAITKTMLKSERRKQDRKSRKHFDNATRKFHNK